MTNKKVVIGGKEHSWDELSTDVQKLVASLHFVEERIKKCEEDTEIFKFAKAEYVKKLQEIMKDG